MVKDSVLTIRMGEWELLVFSILHSERLCQN